MNKKTHRMIQGAIIAAMYFTLTHLQNILIPGSATWAIQCRLSEALSVLAFFTPAAIQGLAVGCALFNLSFAGALPLDIIVGPLATAMACFVMWKSRKVTFKGYPLLGMIMPALFNALLIGWELTIYLGDTGFTMAVFCLNAFYVALGELIVLLIPGTVLYRALLSRGLTRKLFE